MPREYFKGTAEEDRAYSPAIKVTGGTTVYLAGVGATTDANGKSLGGDLKARCGPLLSAFGPTWLARVVTWKTSSP